MTVDRHRRQQASRWRRTDGSVKHYAPLTSGLRFLSTLWLTVHQFSVFTGTQRTSEDASELGEVLDSALRALSDTDHWDVSTDNFWCRVTPNKRVGRSQGWKLHLSATVLPAPVVLARALPVLLKASSAFKFAGTLEHVALLNARHTPRGHSGKFVTVYPESDEEAVRLAEALHDATTCLAEPRVLSDRPYAPFSLLKSSSPGLPFVSGCLMG
jgi:hypothetical protein